MTDQLERGRIVPNPAAGHVRSTPSASIARPSRPQQHSHPAELRINLGQNEAGNHAVSALPEHLLGRHCAVVGATGGGKSWTLGRIIEEISQFRSKVVLFDAAGEFGALDNGVTHLSVGVASSENEKAVSVPYYHLRESDLFAIFKPSGPSQGPKFRAAIHSLKLALLAPILSADGTILKAHRSKVEFERERARFISQIESPYNEFDIRHLPQQIQNECIDPQRSPTEPMVWGSPNGLDLSYCVPLVNRIQDMVHSPNLEAIFKPRRLPSIFDEVPAFLDDPDSKVLRISLKHLPFEHNTREILGNSIARHLLELARASRFLKQPLLIVLDEAHQFLSKALRDNENFPLDAFGLIAKEGRKYALNILLSTQRPRDIPDDVLSQMGVFLIHRMTNDYDLSVVERASGVISREVMLKVPTLLPGHAVMVGVSIDEPIVLKVNPPKNRPDSRGPDFQNCWR
ncbi:MAG: ATP-binding protein [Deltaproteobacteria bacterium]|nr:ATP-binding protein [Deltaproteobacteria bacterium]